MPRSHRSRIILVGVSTACALIASSAPARAQAPPRDVDCKKTETQAECHARLRCKPNEELEDCQKRLLRCKAEEKLDDCKKRVGAPGAKEGNAGRDDAEQRGGDRGADEAGRDREADREGGEDRDQRGDRGAGDEEAGSRRERGGRRGGDGGGDGGRGGGGGDGGSGYQANKTFGLGLELGEPTGLNGKLFLSDSGALDFGVGWIYRHYYYGDGLHIYADYLWHPVSLVSSAALELPLYLGAGLRFWEFHYCFQGLCDYGGSAIGIRVPIGIAFEFNNVPLDIFLQLVPVLDFLEGDYYDRYRDRAHVGVDVSAGIRYWFF